MQSIEGKKNLADALNKYKVEMWKKLSEFLNDGRWTKVILVEDVLKTG